MTDRDDGDANDPQLQSLRAVWLAMPDEEPPQRGFAELMAAARVKAEEMATPSLWQRITALLRRPPVLALATVLVLIGGAVFIGQRKEAIEVDYVAEPPLAAAPTGAGSAAASAPGARSAEDEADLEMIADPMIPEPTFEAEPRSVATPAVTRRPKKKDRVDTGIAVPQEERRRRLTAEADDSADENVEAGSRGRDIAKPAESRTATASDRFAAPVAKGEQGARAGGAAPSKAIVAPTTTAAPDSSREVPAPRAPAQDSPREAPAPRATTQPPPPSRAAQDLAQAKAAIARGDCATARTLMKRVATDDAAAYRQALANDAALKSCVVAQ